MSESFDTFESKQVSKSAGRPQDELQNGVKEHLVSLLTPTSLEAEQYRVLRHKVEQMHRTDGQSIFAVCSPGVGDGKTTTAINLSGALAQGREARVLLVELDLRRPSVGSRLGLSDAGARGLADVIMNPGLALEEAVCRLPFNLSVLLAGQPQEATYELLKSQRLAEILKQARQQYDYVVLDTPPLVPVPDCQLIANCVDSFFVVVAAHRTPRKLLEEALNRMEPAKVAGIVFNNDDSPLWRYYGYYYVRSPKAD